MYFYEAHHTRSLLVVHPDSRVIGFTPWLCSPCTLCHRRSETVGGREELVARAIRGPQLCDRELVVALLFHPRFVLSPAIWGGERPSTAHSLTAANRHDLHPPTRCAALWPQHHVHSKENQSQKQYSSTTKPATFQLSLLGYLSETTVP